MGEQPDHEALQPLYCMELGTGKDMQARSKHGDGSRTTGIHRQTSGIPAKVKGLLPQNPETSIIDREIDHVLAERHYGFTDEELDFIINYDIKYRMGREGVMQDTVLQDMATNIVVISVALLAVTIFLFAAAWQGLFQYVGLLSVQGRRDVSAMIFWSFVFFSAVFGVYIAMYYFGPEMVRIFIILGVYLLAVIEFIFFAFIFVWNILRHGRLPRFSRSKEPDVEEWEKVGMLAYSSSVFNIVLSVFSFVFSLVTAMDATVETGMRSNPAEDVDFSRWSLLAGTTAFFLGMMLLGAGKFVDLYRFLDSKAKGEEAPETVPEDNHLPDQDKA